MLHLQRFRISHLVNYKSYTRLLSTFLREISNDGILARAAEYPCKVMDAKLTNDVGPWWDWIRWADTWKNGACFLDQSWVARLVRLDDRVMVVLLALRQGRWLGSFGFHSLVISMPPRLLTWWLGLCGMIRRLGRTLLLIVALLWSEVISISRVQYTAYHPRAWPQHHSLTATPQQSFLDDLHPGIESEYLNLVLDTNLQNLSCVSSRYDKNSD